MRNQYLADAMNHFSKTECSECVVSAKNSVFGVSLNNE